MSITNFTTNFAGGTRKNRFKVRGTNGGGSFATNFIDNLTPFHIVAAAMPASIITTNPIDFRGRKILYPGDRVYSAEGFNVWTMTVLDDINGTATGTYKNLWHAAHAWSDAINDHETNQGSVSYCDIIVEQLSLNGEDTTGGASGNPIKRATLKNAWPQSISPLDMEMQARDQYNSFDITFAFHYVDYDTTLTG